MEVLADRSLITVSSNLLHMHELIQSMAREIVREESNIPGNRSRLSVPSEVYDVLHGNKATETVEVLHLLEEKCSEKVDIDVFYYSIDIKELPCFVLSLENLQSLSFGGHQGIPSRWLPSISSLFSFLSKSQYPKSLESCTSGGLPVFRFVNLSYCNIFQVSDSIGGLSCLKSLNLGGNSFTSLPKSLSHLSQLGSLTLDGCNKLEVLPVLPHKLSSLSTYHCTSMRKRAREFNHQLLSCNITGRPNKSRKITVDSQVSVSQTQLLDSSITSHGATNHLCSLLQHMSNQINKYGTFQVQGHTFCGSDKWDILFYGDSIPHWFRNHNMGNHVMVQLPSDGCHNKFRGYGTCIVYKRKKSYDIPGYIVRNFDGTILGNASPFHCFPLNDSNSIGIRESHVIWLHYNTSIWGWKEAKSFASFTFKDNEDVEVKECAVTLFCDEDIQETDSMIQDLPNPTRKGGIFTLHGNSSISSLLW